MMTLPPGWAYAEGEAMECHRHRQELSDREKEVRIFGAGGEHDDGRPGRG